MSGTIVLNQLITEVVNVDGYTAVLRPGTTIPSNISALLVAGSDGYAARFIRVSSDGTLRVDPTGVTTQPISGSVSADTTSVGIISSGNSSTTPLGVGATFTGSAIDMLSYSTIRISAFSDKTSATNGLQVQFSNDAVNWDFNRYATLAANAGSTAAFNRAARYCRVVYTNGGAAQGVFRLQTVIVPVSAEFDRHFVGEAPAESHNSIITQSVIWGKTTGGGGGYVAVKVNPSGAVTADATQSGTWTARAQDGYGNPTIVRTAPPELSDPGLVVRVVSSSSDGYLASLVNLPTSGTASRTTIANSTAAVTLLNLNSTRKGATVINTSNRLLYLALGAASATVSDYTIQISSNGYYEIPFGFTGRISGIWSASGSGGADVTELT